MSARTRPFFAMVVVVAALGSSCKCGKEKTTEKLPAEKQSRVEATVAKLPAAGRGQVLQVIPAGAGFVLFSPDAARAWKWISENQSLAALRRTNVWRDLLQSGPAWLVSSLRHRLARLSKVSLGDWSLESLLAAPVALARYPGAKDRPGGAWLLVKQIDLRLQAVDRLAEAFNQVEEKSGQAGAFDWEGVKVRTLSLGGNKLLYYAVFSNLLLVCNHQQTMISALFLATGRDAQGLLDTAGLGRALAKLSANSLVLAWAGLDSWEQGAMWNWSPGLVPGGEVIVHLPLAQPERPGLVVGPAPAGTGGRLDESLWKLLPEDSRLVAASALLDLTPGKLGSPKGDGIVQLKSFRGQAALVLGGLESGAKAPPLFDAALLLRPRKGQWREKDARAVMKFVFGGGMQQTKVDNVTSYRSAAAGQPGGMLLDGWLVLASTGRMLEKIVQTRAGRSPCLADWPGFAKATNAGRAPVVLAADAENVFADLSAYAAWLDGQHGRKIGRTMTQALGPFLDACRRAGRMGLALQQQERVLEGTLLWVQ